MPRFFYISESIREEWSISLGAAEFPHQLPSDEIRCEHHTTSLLGRASLGRHVYLIAPGSIAVSTRKVATVGDIYCNLELKIDYGFMWRCYLMKNRSFQ